MDHILRCHPVNGVNFVRGQNCALFDDQGRRFTDLESGSWAAVLGHGHPRVNRVIKDQADRIMHLGVRTPNELAELAARDVLDLAGLPDGRCTFLSSGSEAVEFGVQAARRVTGRPFDSAPAFAEATAGRQGRPLLLTFADSYLAAFGSAGRKDPSEWHLLDWHAPGADDVTACLASLPFDRIGGFVFEPGGGAPGFVRFPPAPLVGAIARRVQADGGVVVANEITTGMGRTGKWFGYQHYDLRPDIVALGKGLGNGFPVSATAIRREVADELLRRGFHHAQSHQNNPLGCAVAREVIAILREERLIERGRDLGASFLARLRDLQARNPKIKDVRGRGMLLAVEFAPDSGLSGSAVQAALWDHGFIAAGYPAGYPAGTGLRFDPALTIDEADLDRLLGALADVLT